MIIGIGIDFVEIKKITKYIESDAFQHKVFTPEELESCKNLHKKNQCLAGKLAAKEAFMKAISHGIRQEVWFTQIEVLTLESGQPYINVSGEAKRWLDELKANYVHVSISHEDNHAVAVVILESAT